MKHIPNIISIARIFFSLNLLAFHFNSIMFIILYLLCGISDILDGYLARKYKIESRRGEQLDSLGDFIFFIIIIYLVFSSTNLLSYNSLLTGMIVILVIRIINVVMTKVKFKTWGMLHTWGNKLVGLLLYIYIAIIIVSGNILFVPGVVLCLIAIVSASEETIILLSIKKYDANYKSIINLLRFK